MDPTICIFIVRYQSFSRRINVYELLINNTYSAKLVLKKINDVIGPEEHFYSL